MATNPMYQDVCNLENREKLTEFGHMSPEDPGSGSILSWFLGKKGGSGSSSPRSSSPKKNTRPTTLDTSRQDTPSPDMQRQSPSITSTASDKSLEGSEEQEGKEAMIHRTFDGVLKRLGKLMDRKTPIPKVYKDSDFKQYWMPDHNCRECYECGDKFNTFRRRHHCRICGQIFCSRCCNQAVPGKIMGYTGDLRACTYCCTVVLTYVEQVSDQAGDWKDIREDLKELDPANNDPSLGLYQDALRIFTPQSKRKSSAVFDDEMSKCIDTPNSGLFDITPQQDFAVDESFSRRQERKLLIEASTQLKELWLLINHPEEGLEFLSHRYRLRTYPTCITGRNLITWLLQKDKAASRFQAVAIGQALLDARWLDCCSLNEQTFKDEYVLYRPGEAAIRESPADAMVESAEMEDEHEPQWVRTIRRIDEDVDNISWSEHNKVQPMVLPAEEVGEVADEILDTGDSGEVCPGVLKRSHGQSMFYTSPGFVEKENVPDGNPDVSIPDFSAKKEVPIFMRGQSVECDMPDTWRYIHLNQLGENNGEKQAYEILGKAFQDHTQGLVKQLLSKEGLSLSWADIIMKLAKKVSETVRPDVKFDMDDMDIRQYVHIKKVPGGQKANCAFVNGVVFSKNVAHKKMNRNMLAPKILLLGSSIEYQTRKENKLSSLEPQVLQEHEFLKKSVAKIAKLKPNLLLVEKTVSNLAQKFVLESGITLILNVKQPVMERVSRLAQADVVPSIDSLVGGGRLGVCGNFRIQNFAIQDKCKPLAFLEGCPQHLGCSIILQGGSMAELKKIKTILHFMIYMGYNSMLEMSLLMDEFAQPPLVPLLSIPGVYTEGNNDKEHPNKQTKQPHISKDNETLLHGGMVTCGRLRRVSNSETVLEAMDQYMESQLTSQLESIEMETDGDLNITGCETKNKRVKSENKILNTDGDIVPTNKAGIEQSDLARDVVLNSNGSNVSEPGVGSVTTSSNEKSDGNKRHSGSLSRSLSKPAHHVTDESDPLQSYQKHQDESIFETNLAFEEEIHKHHVLFKKALRDTILSTSPFLVLSVPYLETELGMRSSLRHYFPSELFWSEHFLREPHIKNRNWDLDNIEKLKAKTRSKVEIIPSHPFVLETITEPISSKKLQALLADFRARGGTIRQLSPEEIRQKRQEVRTVTGFSEMKSEDAQAALAGLEWEKKKDCLNPEMHQQLSVLFSSYCNSSPNYPYPCVSPWIVVMDFYGRNDITLGGFLERYCFRESYNCPSQSCNQPMVEHIRRFVHDKGSIHIMLKKVKSGIHVSERRIYMWSWCRKCKQVTPVVPMSQDTWSISFAKYLELRFHGNMYGRRASANPCCDSIHHDHYQYFGFKNTVAAFKYSKVTLREVIFPPPVVEVCALSNKRQKVIEDCSDLSIKGYGVYSSILEYLVRVRGEVQAEGQVWRQAAEYIEIQKIERAKFRDQIETLNNTLTKPSDSEDNLLSEKEYYMCLDLIANLKKIVAEAVIHWNNKLVELQQIKSKLEKEAKNGNKNSSSSNSPLVSVSYDHPLKEEIVIEPPTTEIVSKSLAESQGNTTGSNIEREKRPSVVETEIAEAMEESVQEPVFQSSVYASDERTTSESTVDSRNNSYSVSLGLNAGVWQSKESVDEDTFIMCNDRDVSDMPSDTNSDNRSSGGLSLATDSTKSINTQVTDSMTSNSTQITESTSSSKAVTKPINVKNVKDGTSNGSPRRSAGAAGMSMEESLVFQESGKMEKRGSSGVKAMFSNLWSMSGNMPLSMPFSLDEHHLLKQSTRVPIVIYDQEPSSIIAYALSSSEYEAQLQELRLEKSTTNSQHSSPGTIRKAGIQYVQADDATEKEKKLVKKPSMLSFFKKDPVKVERETQPTKNLAGKPVNVKYTPDENVLESPDEPDFSFLTASENDKDKQPNQHIELQFDDTQCGGNSKYYCKVYFADHFRKLRKSLYPAGETRFIRSLSRCVVWLAKGGKSGATFCKSKDDRFVLKQMSLKEIQSFVDFAPHYFQYVTKSNSENSPTVLAKIFGVYRIGFRNSLTGMALKQDLLVMENLFYNRNITQKFDLKGSMRNRLVNTSNTREPELVLLDENIVRLGLESPLYIRSHSKRALTSALTNDTEFLSKHFVMDYSLLVGIDDEKKELVVGIIDYIRTFTWDKKLEMVVKSSYGMIVSNEKGKMPTVVSPEIYRNRFLEAMDSYFLLVPDRWSGLENMDTL